MTMMVNRFPTAAFVRTYATEALALFKRLKMLLHGTAANAKRGSHAFNGKMWVFSQKVQKFLFGFLTTFSYHLFLTTYKGFDI